MTRLQERVLAALRSSTSGALTCEDLAVELGDVTAQGVAQVLTGLQRRRLVRWVWVQRGGARARKGYRVVPEGEA